MQQKSKTESGTGTSRGDSGTGALRPTHLSISSDEPTPSHCSSQV